MVVQRSNPTRFALEFRVGEEDRAS
jgi:hypothetical protein